MSRAQSNRVARHFETEWREYDRQIRAAIPFYDDALATAVGVLQASRVQPARILDLGIGTGNLASLLLAAFPDAHLTGIDLVQEFLGIVRGRLSAHADRIDLQRIDVADYDFSAGHDLVVSSFLFHHLDNETKQTLYSRVFSCLTPGGTFINLDFVDSASVFYSRVFYELRVDFMRRQGASEEEYAEHRKLDIPVPMEMQLRWLSDLGFIDTECFWKYLNLAIFGGRKP